VTGATSETKPTVFVVDDDPDVREALGTLLRSAGLESRQFASVPEFLQSQHPDGPTCLILDVRLPGPSGLDFQRELAAANIQLPIIFISAHADIAMSVQAMKRGALEFFTKPCRDQDLLDAIHVALEHDRLRREHERRFATLWKRFALLTSREREVMGHVVKGHLNKQIAADMGIAEATVKVHRCQIMRKMQAPSLPDLARMADKLNSLSSPEKPTQPDTRAGSGQRLPDWLLFRTYKTDVHHIPAGGRDSATRRVETYS
jgi:FixJ family two-component response regulator